MSNRIYLDYAASTPLDPRVKSAMEPFWNELFANPGSKHSDGILTRKHIEDSRKTVAEILGVKLGEIIPIIIKADTKGGVEAIEGELGKIKEERVQIKITKAKTGNVTENDVKTAGGSKDSIIIGFHVKKDRGVDALAERLGVRIETFDIIYKLTEWLEKVLKENKPMIKTEEIRGKVRVLKIFSKDRDKQVVGGEVFEGVLGKGDKLKILRRGEEIGTGVVTELQSGKAPVNSVNEGNQFGAKITSSTEIAERDNLESFAIILK